jgi:SAM-dependent methyltransferase
MRSFLNHSNNAWKNFYYSANGVPNRGKTPDTAAETHTSTGTNWQKGAANIYASTKHGIDGDKFLDPYFLELVLSNIAGQNVIDLGCGAGHWGIVCHQNRAQSVIGIDINSEMITAANQAKEIGINTNDSNCDLESKVTFKVGDVTKLSEYEDNSFDKAISINVGCNLSDDALLQHLKEAFRVLKPGASLIVTAPANLNLIFTDGTKSTSECIKEINKLLSALPEGLEFKDFSTIIRQNFPFILRATFTKDSAGRYTLLCDQTGTNCEIQSGAEIFRKLPSLVVPNIFHPDNLYSDLARIAGFNISKHLTPKFESTAELELYNNCNPDTSLCEQYLTNPFLILELVKPVENV